MADQSPRDRSRLTVRRYASPAEADRHDLEYWLQIPQDERALQAWRLTEDQWRLAGKRPDQPRLRLRSRFGPIDVDFIGRDAFIRNKRATGRPKDLVDIEGFE